MLALALTALMMVAIAIATWQSLAGEQLLLSEPPRTAEPSSPADITHEPMPGSRVGPPADSPTGDTSGGSEHRASPVTVGGTTLWLALNVPLMYIVVRLQQRLWHWFSARKAAIAPAGEDEETAIDHEPSAAPSSHVDGGDEPVPEDPTAYASTDMPAQESVPTGDDGEPARELSAAPDAIRAAKANASQPAARTNPASISGPPGTATVLYDRRAERRIQFDVLASLEDAQGVTLVRTVNLSVSMIVCRVAAAHSSPANGCPAQVKLRIEGSFVTLPVLVAWRREETDAVHTLGLQFRTLRPQDQDLLRAAVLGGVGA